MSILAEHEYRKYMDTVVVPLFSLLIDKDIYSLLINRDLRFEICTNKTAKSAGCSNWQELQGVSFLDYNREDIALRFFKSAYNENTKKGIEEYFKKILLIQNYVLNHQKVVSFIDLLPYNNQFKSYMTTYTPVFHPNGEVVAIQTYAIECRFLGFLEQLNILESNLPSAKKYKPSDKLTIREHEVGFLLSNGSTQDQISQILNISRNTVAAIIRNQLCPKFGIPGANTKLLVNALISAGIQRNMPPTIWKPCIIVLEETLASQFEQQV